MGGWWLERRMLGILGAPCWCCWHHWTGNIQLPQCSDHLATTEELTKKVQFCPPQIHLYQRGNERIFMALLSWARGLGRPTFFSFWRVWHNGRHCDLTVNLKYPEGGTAMPRRKDPIECHFSCGCQTTFVWHVIHTLLTLPKPCTSPQVTPHYSSTGTTEFSLFSEGIAR